MNDITQKKMEQDLLAIADGLVRVYTSPRHPGADDKGRIANITGVHIDNTGIILTAYESDDQARGVRVGVQLNFDLLPVLADLLVKLHRDRP